MSAVLPPPTLPPGSSTNLTSFDDLRRQFWNIALEELELNSASLSDECEGLLLNLVSRGARRFLNAPSSKQNILKAKSTLREFVRELVKEAASLEKMVATMGGSSPVLTVDREVFEITLQKISRWSFWPFT
jgi:hypothetical protein